MQFVNYTGKIQKFKKNYNQKFQHIYEVHHSDIIKSKS